MKNTNNLLNLHVFMIGIGGVSMSGLAKLLISNGVKVSGSDCSHSSELDFLESLGANVYAFHDSKNITKKIDLVIYTGAIRDNNCELIQAKKLNIRTIERSEFLGLISQRYNQVVAISGTHGKTTTTAMIGEIFVQAGLNPTIHLGGKSVNLMTNTVVGSHDYFILEACEYRNSFKYLRPNCTVITNIDSDHLDFYKDLSDIQQAFQYFANNSNNIITNNIKIAHNNLITLANHYSIKNLHRVNHAFEYDVYYENKFFVHIVLKMIGLHNVENSIFAIAVANFYKIPKEIISSALGNFKGVERRYEYIGEFNAVPIIIDYAHHPTEIKSSLKGISSEYENVLCIFQPHTYSRTLQLFDQFINVLESCKNLIIFKTYPAREQEIVGGRAEDLYDAIKKPCYLITNFEDLVCEVKKLIDNKSIDCVLVLGAGDLAVKLKNLKKQ